MLAKGCRMSSATHRACLWQHRPCSSDQVDMMASLYDQMRALNAAHFQSWPYPRSMGGLFCSKPTCLAAYAMQPQQDAFAAVSMQRFMQVLLATACEGQGFMGVLSAQPPCQMAAELSCQQGQRMVTSGERCASCTPAQLHSVRDKPCSTCTWRSPCQTCTWQGPCPTCTGQSPRA